MTDWVEAIGDASLAKRVWGTTEIKACAISLKCFALLTPIMRTGQTSIFLQNIIWHTHICFDVVRLVSNPCNLI